MLARERQMHILTLLREHNIVKISELAERFGVSNLTVRRDLDLMQEEGLVQRVHGGAILETPVYEPSAITPHPRWNQERELQAIGQKAASMIKNGDTIFLGNGTTVLAIAQNIHHLSNLTVFTSSMAVVSELSKSNFNIHVLGGLLDINELFTYGASTLREIGTFCAKKAFIGCGGVTIAHGVTDYISTSSEISRAMIQHADRTILVVSSRKFGTNAMSIVCPLEDLDMVITDTALSQVHADRLKDANVDLILAEPSGDY